MKYQVPEEPSATALALAKRIADIDKDYGDCFGLKFGGDGDAGEILACYLTVIEQEDAGQGTKEQG